MMVSVLLPSATFNGEWLVIAAEFVGLGEVPLQAGIEYVENRAAYSDGSVSGSTRYPELEFGTICPLFVTDLRWNCNRTNDGE